MADAPVRFSFDLDVGLTGVHSLVTFPKLELTPEPPSVNRLTKPVTEVVLKGKCKGPTDGHIPCRLVWLVAGPDGQQHEHVEEGILDVKGKAYEVKVKPAGGGPEAAPKLDFAAHELMGSGKVGYRIEPTWPLAQALVVAPGVITFDNSVKVTPALHGGAPMLGSRVVFTLEAHGAFDEFLKGGGQVNLEMAEMRKVAGQKQPKPCPICAAGWNAADYGKQLAWNLGNADTEIVEHGHPIAPRPLLAYADSAKTSHHDFTYSVQLVVPGQQPATYTLLKDTLLFSVPGAKLDRFGLEFRMPNRSTSFPGTMEDQPRIVVSGSISGISPDLGLPLELALWWVRGGKNATPTLVGAKTLIHLEAVSFSETLVTLPIASAPQAAAGVQQWPPLAAVPKESKELANFLWGYAPGKSGHHRVLFATLRIPSEAVLNVKQPLGSVLGYDVKAYESFDEGKARFVEAAKARAICSPESKDGVPFAMQVGEALRGVYGPPRSL
jgi:hypothetical protein